MKKKFYITTSIAYTNAPPHIGFALEAIQADVLARYHRLLGDNVFFLTGTDEHGSKIERAAKEAGKTPEQFTNEISEKFQNLKDALNISNNDFIRTTDRKRHWPTVERVWKQLLGKGDIYKKKYKGLYCVGCEAFVKEKDLVDGKCPNHQKEPEIIEEENYFFRLSEYSKQVKEEIEKGDIKIIPETRENEILSFIDQGIEDISVSRSKEKLKWGIPVPGDPDQIIYVWFEALLNYLYPKDRWPADVHCVGKDIFRFHALMWPAMLIALDLPRPKNILVHGFINVNGQKMSKSLGNIVDPFELVSKYGTDAVRYFLLREIPSTEDGDFTYEKFEERYNSDLARGLGNLVARVLKLTDGDNKPRIKNDGLKRKIEEIEKNYKNSLENFRFNDALAEIWELISVCDKYIEQKKPWETKDKEVICDLLYAISKISEFLQPFLPKTSEKILDQLKEKRGKSLFLRI
ncbi:MAG: methionine--tRNA ligase [Candidatus Pacebacteria bacterium]|nr:methionine--tRNA ligase [Candidatus Paceibacterota bacterium]